MMSSAGEKALRYFIGAVQAGPQASKRPLVGSTAPPWCEILERCSRTLRASVAYAIYPLLLEICEQADKLTPEQRTLAGITARRVLEFAWSEEPRNKWLVIHALEAVCRTFESDPAASVALLRRALEKSHLDQYGFEEIYWLAHEAKRLLLLDPLLVEDIYRASFTRDETSDGITQMGTSSILTLTSTRAQDWNMARYLLAEVFPEFLKIAPVNALRALSSSIEAYVATRHAPSSGEQVIEDKFDFNGKEASIRTDYSSIWDEGNTYRHDEALKIVDAFQEYLHQLGDNNGHLHERQHVIDVTVSENRLAILWRRLLKCGIAAPHTWGKDLRALSWSIPILMCYDTTVQGGNFIKAIFGNLNVEERKRVERAILSIPDLVEEKDREGAEHIRDRLLGCLLPEMIETEEAKEILKELISRGKMPDNEPPFRFSGLQTRPYGEKEYLAGEGVPVEHESNERIRDIETPIKEFNEKHLNSITTFEEIRDMFPTLLDLADALLTADADGVHPKQRDYAWGCLAEACVRVAKSESISCEDEIGLFVREVLLKAAHHRDPIYDPKYDSRFDEGGPSWSKPAPRIDAAEGLMLIARFASCVDKDLLKEIDQLSHDEVPAVRYQIANYLITLYETATNVMWEIIERLAKEEQSRGVLQGLVAHTISSFSGPFGDRVANITKIIFDRVIEGSGASEVRELCVSLFTDLYIWQDQRLSSEVISQLVINPLECYEEIHQIIIRIGHLLTYGPLSPLDLKAEEVRKKAFSLLSRILEATIKSLAILQTRYNNIPFESLETEDQNSFRGVFRLADSICMEVYSASGSLKRKQIDVPSSPADLGRGEKLRFLQEAGSLIRDLADLGLPRIVHHLLETLEHLLDLDPEGVFLLIGRIIRSGTRYGYHYESMAEGLMVRLVERFLAEYRPLLKKNEECRRVLIEILDTFIGWPSARRLTYRLEEIFR